MSNQQARITPEELKSRMSAGEEFTIIDARNPQAWAEAPNMAGGAIRVDGHSTAPLPTLSRKRPIVIYCT